MRGLLARLARIDPQLTNQGFLIPHKNSAAEPAKRSRISQPSGKNPSRKNTTRAAIASIKRRR
jgi:hypothetical protein